MIFLLLFAAIAAAGSPPPRSPRTGLAEQIGRPEADAMLRVNGMSEAGIAALHRLPAAVAVDPREARCGVQRAATASPLDVAALERALAARDAAIAAAASARRGRLVSELRLLGPGDAALLLKLVGTGEGPVGPGGPGGPPPGPPPGGIAERHDPAGPPPGRMEPPPMMQDNCGPAA